MRQYKTQMEAARKGIVTEELKIVAKKELMTEEELLPLVASGKVVICANKNHKSLDPEVIGSIPTFSTTLGPAGHEMVSKGYYLRPLKKIF